MPKHKFLNPDTIAKPVGYTHVVEPTVPGRIFFISGQLGLDTENKIVGSLATSARRRSRPSST
jgi:enamine deaminase RidA (YjgF/YER057c/UK114 family)